MQSSEAPKGSRRTLRYYICAEGRLRYRIPNAMHKAMVQGAISLPQFANSALFVLEVARLISPSASSTRTVGTVYQFNAEGLLDIRQATELLGSSLDAVAAKSAKVVPLSDILKHRRLRATGTWSPDKSLVQAAEADAELPRSKIAPLTSGSTF